LSAFRAPEVKGEYPDVNGCGYIAYPIRGTGTFRPEGVYAMGSVDWISFVWIVWEVGSSLVTQVWLRPLTTPEWISAGIGIVFGFAILFAEFRGRVANLKSSEEDRQKYEKDRMDLKLDIARVTFFNEGAFATVGHELNALRAGGSQDTQEIITRIQQVMAKPPILKPQILYVCAPETLNPPSGNLYTHLRFRNRPSGRAALDVEARIKWATENGQELLSLLGKWQEVRWDLGRAMYPANGIDLAPDDKEHGLDLCIRKPNSPDFYAVDIQGAALRNSYVADCLLKSGTYKVFVKLSCDGFAEKLVFQVKLEGTNPPRVDLVDA
jgi:hypothetical protein